MCLDDALIEKSRPRLLFVAQRRGVPPQDCEDVVHETLLTALHQLSRGIRPELGKFGPWLETILRGKVADYWRDHVRRGRVIASQGVEFQDGEQSVVAEPVGHEQDQVELLALREAVSRLKPRHRIAIILFEVQGIPANEIARRLGWPRGTVYRILFEARHQLAKYFCAGEDLRPVKRQIQQGDQTGGKA